jgi:hypothetical protein
LDFNQPLANTNSFEIGLEIEQKIQRLAWQENCTSIFHEVCPGYSNKPHATLKHIFQTYKDGEGTLVTTPIVPYYQKVMNAIHPISEDTGFPVSFCNYLIDGLDQRLVLIFHPNYLDYG